MQKIILKVHSFIDIITNSSTEIYVEATQSTVSSIKTLVNSLLAIGGSQLTCDDLFEITLEDTEESDEYPTVDLCVVAKEPGQHAEVAAKILNGLTSIFNIEAAYNG